MHDGDEWIVNGQKVWTSLAHEARWGLLVARTDPDVPKHRGLTYFINDMHAPGVDVRPLRQMTGQAEFNEVYLTDVRIPDAHRLGDVGDGWRISLTTLMNERVAIGGGSFSRKAPIDWAMELYREHGNGNPVLRDEVVRMWMQHEVLRYTVRRGAAAQSVGTPGPEGSVAKLMSAEHNKACFSLCTNLLGPAGTLYPAGYADGQGPRRVRLPDARRSGSCGRARELDRGRHVRGDAQHPRRAGARPPRRRARRQGHPLEGSPPQLTPRFPVNIPGMAGGF